MTLSDYVSTIRDKRITVLGIGVSNLPLIRMLAQAGCRVTACDRSPREKLAAADELESLGVSLKLGDAYLDGIRADVIFRSPGIRPDLPPIEKAVQDGAVLTSEMEAFFEVCPCRIVAVTGSDGKTTTTTLISKLLKAAGKQVYIGGNIGHPLLCEADGMDPDGFAVVELSSFQLMTMHGRSPDVAVVTNLAPNHLDVHKSMDEYVDAKRNICCRQGPGCVTVLNRDNDLSASFETSTGGEVRWFSMRRQVADGVWNAGEVLTLARSGSVTPLLPVSDIRIPGRHNVENYMAAYAAVCDWVGPDILRDVAATFGGVEHRIEFVRELRGVKYYNDSIASSPSRTRAGLLSFPEKVILIAGGKDKGVPFDELGSDVIAHVKKLIVTGLTRDKIRDAVESRPEYRGDPPVLTVEDFREAVLRAAAEAEPGDIVLLSPACTSFDRFRNFEERGRFFKQIVNEME